MSTASADAQAMRVKFKADRIADLQCDSRLWKAAITAFADVADCAIREVSLWTPHATRVSSALTSMATMLAYEIARDFGAEPMRTSALAIRKCFKRIVDEGVVPSDFETLRATFIDDCKRTAAVIAAMGKGVAV